MCLNYAQRIWIKLLFPTPLCWMLLNIISWSVMILHRLRRTTQKQLSILSLKIFSYLRRNASYLRSSLMAFVGPFTLVVDWRSHHNPVWGMSGMCLGSWEAGADPTDHMSDGSWYRARVTIPRSCQSRHPPPPLILARVQHATRDWTRGVFIFSGPIHFVKMTP